MYVNINTDRLPSEYQALAHRINVAMQQGRAKNPKWLGKFFSMKKIRIIQNVGVIEGESELKPAYIKRLQDTCVAFQNK